MTAERLLSPEPWTRTSAERVIVVLIAFGWLLLCSPIPSSLSGAGMIVTLVLIALDIVLGIRTRWLAFGPSSRLDERQGALRDDAYRNAFHWMRAAVVLMLVLAALGSGANSVEGQQSPAGISLRFLVAFLELLVILPTAVIGWQIEAGLQSAEPSPSSIRKWSPLLLVPAVSLAWLAAGNLLPARTLNQLGGNVSFDMEGASCNQFLVGKEVAAGFAGAVGFHAEVCWNGRQAFAFGDPSLGLPAGILPAQEVLPNGPSLPDLTACSPGRLERDFAVVSQSCSEQIDADGTMTLTAHGQVSPLPGGLAGRELQVRLIVSRDGKVVRIQ